MQDPTRLAPSDAPSGAVLGVLDGLSDVALRELLADGFARKRETVVEHLAAAAPATTADAAPLVPERQRLAG